MTLRALLLAAGLWASAANAASGHAASESLRYCDRQQAASVKQQDLALRFAAIFRRELEDSGAELALVARSGLDLSRFGLHYSHAGVILKSGAGQPWSVRQLYFDCDEGRPRLYDQGIAGFMLGADDPAISHASMILLPPAEATALEAVARDNPHALRLLAADYSANAFAFSTRYQNCNQWLIELAASAWGGLDDGQDLRERAQHWLAAQGYAPAPIEVGSRWLMLAATFVPWVHVDDHPPQDLQAMHFRTSMPGSIEAFVQQRLPGAQRIELCHDAHQVVIHRGWDAVGAGCQPGAGDRVIALD